MCDEMYMRMAIEKCREGIAAGQTPFGACIVLNDEVVALEHNVVWRTTDITAHAEINAIRKACEKLNTISLKGAVIYSTCEPCPMCFSAIHWAGIARIVYGAGIEDAADAGFNELPINNRQLRELGRTHIQITEGILRDEACRLFSEWKEGPAFRPY